VNGRRCEKIQPQPSSTPNHADPHPKACMNRIGRRKGTRAREVNQSHSQTTSNELAACSGRAGGATASTNAMRPPRSECLGETHSAVAVVSSPAAATSSIRVRLGGCEPEAREFVARPRDSARQRAASRPSSSCPRLGRRGPNLRDLCPLSQRGRVQAGKRTALNQALQLAHPHSRSRKQSQIHHRYRC
jgi:hypothetical protein